jgi:hypothetical protein
VPGDTPADAVHNFQQPLQDVIHCIANAYVNVRGGYHVRAEPHTLVLNDADRINLNGARDLSITVSHDYEIIENPEGEQPWRCHSRGYIYHVYEGGRPIYGWHWHPGLGTDITYPHVHPYLLDVCEEDACAMEILNFRSMAKVHLPTGRVSLEGVVRFLIRDLGVQPRLSQYREILDHREAAFDAHRTW